MARGHRQLLPNNDIEVCISTSQEDIISYMSGTGGIVWDFLPNQLKTAMACPTFAVNNNLHFRDRMEKTSTWENYG